MQRLNDLYKIEEHNGKFKVLRLKDNTYFKAEFVSEVSAKSMLMGFLSGCYPESNYRKKLRQALQISEG